jgi:hypothetical protein
MCSVSDRPQLMRLFSATGFSVSATTIAPLRKTAEVSDDSVSTHVCVSRTRLFALCPSA